MVSETDERLYRLLKAVAVLLGLGTLGWMLVQQFDEGWDAASAARRAADRAFEDGHYARAYTGYREAEALAPDNPFTLRGMALSLLQLGRHQEAKLIFDKLMDVQPDFAINYANRGILFDRMGRYREAIADYEKALALDADMVKGPSWITRFLRNQSEAPPAIADRLAYIKAELQKPEAERVMHDSVQDTAQRPYKR